MWWLVSDDIILCVSSDCLGVKHHLISTIVLLVVTHVTSLLSVNLIKLQVWYWSYVSFIPSIISVIFSLHITYWHRYVNCTFRVKTAFNFKKTKLKDRFNLNAALVSGCIFQSTDFFSCFSFIDDNIGQAVIQKYNSLESAIVEDVCTVVNFPAVFNFSLCANGNWAGWL